MTKYPEEGKVLLALIQLALKNYCTVDFGYEHVTVTRHTAARMPGDSGRLAETVRDWSSQKVVCDSYDDAATHLLQKMIAKGWVKQRDLPLEIKNMLDATITKQRLIDQMVGADPHVPVVVSIDDVDAARINAGATDVSFWAIQQVDVVDGAGIVVILNTREPVSS